MRPTHDQDLWLLSAPPQQPRWVTSRGAPCTAGRERRGKRIRYLSFILPTVTDNGRITWMQVRFISWRLGCIQLEEQLTSVSNEFPPTPPASPSWGGRIERGRPAVSSQHPDRPGLFLHLSVLRCLPEGPPAEGMSARVIVQLWGSASCSENRER